MHSFQSLYSKTFFTVVDEDHRSSLRQHVQTKARNRYQLKKPQQAQQKPVFGVITHLARYTFRTYLAVPNKTIL